MLFLHLRKQAFASDLKSCQFALNIDRPKTQTFVATKDDPSVVTILPVANQKANDALIRGRVPFDFFDKQDRAGISDVSRECFETPARQGSSLLRLRRFDADQVTNLRNHAADCRRVRHVNDASDAVEPETDEGLTLAVVPPYRASDLLYGD